MNKRKTEVYERVPAVCTHGSHWGRVTQRGDQNRGSCAVLGKDEEGGFGFLHAKVELWEGAQENYSKQNC